MPPPNSWTGSETFQPVPEGTEELTLVVDGFDFFMPAEGSFNIDLGDAPAIGDRWDVDVSLDVAVGSDVGRARLDGVTFSHLWQHTG